METLYNRLIARLIAATYMLCGLPLEAAYEYVSTLDTDEKLDTIIDDMIETLKVSKHKGQLTVALLRQLAALTGDLCGYAMTKKPKVDLSAAGLSFVIAFNYDEDVSQARGTLQILLRTAKLWYH